MSWGWSLNHQDLSETRRQGITATALSGTGNRLHLCTLWYMARTVAKEAVPLWHKILFPQKLPNAEQSGSPLCKDKKYCSQRTAVFILLFSWCCIQSRSPSPLVSHLSHCLKQAPPLPSVLVLNPVVAAPSWEVQCFQKTFSPVPQGAWPGRWRQTGARVAAPSSGVWEGPAPPRCDSPLETDEAGEYLCGVMHGPRSTEPISSQSQRMTLTVVIGSVNQPVCLSQRRIEQERA